MTFKFWLAISAYVILALLAAFTMEGPFRLAVWVFLGGLAFKTWLATIRHDDEE